MKGVARSTWDVIIMSGAKTKEKYYARKLEFMRSKMFCKNPILTQVKKLEKTTKKYPFIENYPMT